MPLDQAGVELIAKNYRDYMQQLRNIDKEQQKVFSDQGRGAEQAHRAAANAAKGHERQVKSLEQAYKSMQRIIALVFASRVFREGMEAVEEALDFRRLVTQFENLAQASGQSANEMSAAFQRGAKGTISNARAINSALAAMRLEVAATPAEMEEFVRLAVALRPAGKSAADAVDELVVALGRKSLRVLDNFNVSSARANIEMDKMAQQRFGVAYEDLDTAAKNAVFMEAALKAMRDQFDAMGGDINEIGNDMERMRASAENLKLVIGEALAPGAATLGGELAKVLDTLSQIVALTAAGAAGFEAMFSSVSRGTTGLLEFLASPQTALGKLAAGAVTGAAEGQPAGDIFGEAYRAGQEAYNERLAALARTMGYLSDETGEATIAQDELGSATEDNTKLIEAQQRAVEQAAQIQRNYARAQEDALRKAQRQAEKLQRQQAKELIKLQKDLNEKLADLEADAVQDSADLEADRAKDTLRARQDLNRKLQQEEERFQLSQLQSKRRFNLQDKRLRAEGDILGLQQLREDYDLQQKEEKENFDLSQRQQKESGQDQLKQQEEDFRERTQQLADELENRRAEILSSYDEELAELQAKHAEQREEQSRSLAEQLEDLRRNRAQQLEDLGYHMGQQEEITKQGAQAVADELEKVFGVDGVADQIMSGYTERTESKFTELFRNIEQAVTTGQTAAEFGYSPAATPTIGMQHGFSGVVTGPQNFMVEPGVREFVYAAPLRGSSPMNVNVNMGGGFNITGAEGASSGAVDAALDRMVLEFETAMRRVMRRG